MKPSKCTDLQMAAEFKQAEAGTPVFSWPDAMFLSPTGMENVRAGVLSWPITSLLPVFLFAGVVSRKSPGYYQQL